MGLTVRSDRRNFRQPGNQRQYRSLAHRKLTATQGPERSGPAFSGNAEECVIAGAAAAPPAPHLRPSWPPVWLSCATMETHLLLKLIGWYPMHSKVDVCFDPALFPRCRSLVVEGDAVHSRIAAGVE